MSSPAPPLVNDLPWPKLPLRELALPAGVRVPAGALQKSDASAKALVRKFPRPPEPRRREEAAHVRPRGRPEPEPSEKSYLPTYPMGAASRPRKLPTYLFVGTV